MISKAKTLAVGAAALVASFAATSQTAPKPLSVWVYGDGESGRMLSELEGLRPASITPQRKSPMETTGPTGGNGLEPLSYRLLVDLAAVPAQSWPQLIHIGYNASNASFLYCALIAPTVPESTWKPAIQQIAAAEAIAIDDAADLAASYGFRVLLSKSPGAASKDAVAKAPLVAISAQAKVGRQCMSDAFALVTFFLATLNTYEWVDFSGMTVDSRLGGAPVAGWKLNPGDVWHWEQDGVHISTDGSKYDGKDPPESRIVPYSQSFSVGSGPGQVPRASLGAYRAAQNVLRAYQAIQAQL